MSLEIIDDSEGTPRDDSCAPDLRTVATCIGGSLKKRLEEQGVQEIQGESGIGLLGFRAVGERMEMRKNGPGYSLSTHRALFTHRGTELRDRIRSAGVCIRIPDRAKEESSRRTSTARMRPVIPRA